MGEWPNICTEHHAHEHRTRTLKPRLPHSWKTPCENATVWLRFGKNSTPCLDYRSWTEVCLHYLVLASWRKCAMAHNKDLS